MVEAQLLEGLADGAGLLVPLGREAGGIIPALHAVLSVEAAEPMTDQHNPEGQGSIAARGPSYGRGESRPLQSPSA